MRLRRRTNLRTLFVIQLGSGGAAQARKYAAQLDAAANDLASGQGVFKAWDDVLEGLRVKAVGSHLIFCVVRPGQLPLVLAVLHERMDLMVRLKGRLG